VQFRIEKHAKTALFEAVFHLLLRAGSEIPAKYLCMGADFLLSSAWLSSKLLLVGE
jgi:hypothetical protein